MNSEERQKAVREFKRLIKLKEKYTSLEEERKALLEDPKIKRFLELEEMKNNNIAYDYYTRKTEDELAVAVFREVRPEKKSDIYIYLGAYKNDPLDCDIVHGSGCIRCDGRKDKPEWYLFRSVDSYGDEIMVSPKDYDEFLKKNLILYPKEFHAYEAAERYAVLVIREGIVKARQIIAEEYGKK